jgi:hypothetical protein
MEDPTQHADRALQSWQVFETLDTTRRSFLHKVFGQSIIDRDPTRVTLGAGIYLIFLAITLLPLVITAWVDLPTLVKPSDKLKLPFLYDGNILFMVGISLPLLAAFTITDQPILRTALAKVVRENIVFLSLRDAQTLIDRWNTRFTKINLGAQIVSFIIAAAVAYANYEIYSRPEVGFWTIKSGRFSVTGWVYLYCIFLFYWIVCVTVLRTLTISLFLRDVVKRSQIMPVPFHPDRCGGLRPVGVLGLRTQYLLSVLGMNLLLLFFIYSRMLAIPPELYGLMLLAAIGYVIVGPIVFLIPLLPFREGMLQKKAELVNDVAQRLREEFERIRSKLPKREPLVKEDEEVIERLRKIGALVDELPVWPFDAQTLRKIITAYLVPLSTTLVLSLLKTLLETLTKAK